MDGVIPLPPIPSKNGWAVNMASYVHAATADAPDSGNEVDAFTTLVREYTYLRPIHTFFIGDRYPGCGRRLTEESR